LGFKIFPAAAWLYEMEIQKSLQQIACCLLKQLYAKEGTHTSLEL